MVFEFKRDRLATDGAAQILDVQAQVVAQPLGQALRRIASPRQIPTVPRYIEW